MALPSELKNQKNRTRGENPGAEEPFGFSPKPMLDENPNGGLRGSDKQQGELRDERGIARVR